jgi:ABC-type amino acid transport substrate-binding protein
MTSQREQHSFFSEPYYRTQLAVLHSDSQAMPDDAQTWRGSVGVVSQTLIADIVGGWFPAANVRYFPTLGAAVAALRTGTTEAVFDDAVSLDGFASGGLSLEPLPNSTQYFSVAMALGSRTLLNLIDRAIRRLRPDRSDIPNERNRKTIAHVGREDDAKSDTKRTIPKMDRSLERIRKRGVLRVGIHPGVPGLCEKRNNAAAAADRYIGLEPQLARAIAQEIFGDGNCVEFVEVGGDQRLRATHSWLHGLIALRKSFAIFGTLLGTNWWNLGMAGKLPAFLCPPECVGTLDFVGLDYYWGVPSFWPGELHRLSAAADFQYADAPVWPSALDIILGEASREFPGKPIVVVENGCVAKAAGMSRADYLRAHVAQVRRAVERGAPVDAYLCWSITSNREWGLPFDDGSDFGLYHIDLDTDPELKRHATDSSRAYAELIATGNPTGATTPSTKADE